MEAVTLYNGFSLANHEWPADKDVMLDLRVHMIELLTRMPVAMDVSVVLVGMYAKHIKALRYESKDLKALIPGYMRALSEQLTDELKQAHPALATSAMVASLPSITGTWENVTAILDDAIEKRQIIWALARSDASCIDAVAQVQKSLLHELLKLAVTPEQFQAIMGGVEWPVAMFNCDGYYDYDTHHAMQAEENGGDRMFAEPNRVFFLQWRGHIDRANAVAQAQLQDWSKHIPGSNNMQMFAFHPLSGTRESINSMHALSMPALTHYICVPR